MKEEALGLVISFGAVAGVSVGIFLATLALCGLFLLGGLSG